MVEYPLVVVPEKYPIVKLYSKEWADIRRLWLSVEMLHRGKGLPLMWLSSWGSSVKGYGEQNDASHIVLPLRYNETPFRPSNSNYPISFVGYNPYVNGICWPYYPRGGSKNEQAGKGNG